MHVNLKIEILKVFSLEFSMSSNKELKIKKDEGNAKTDSNTEPAAGGDTKPSK